MFSAEQNLVVDCDNKVVGSILRDLATIVWNWSSVLKLGVA